MKKLCLKKGWPKGVKIFLKQDLEHNLEQKAKRNEKFAGNGCLKGSKNIILLGYKEKS